MRDDFIMERGLGRADFRPIGLNGLGDPLNSYPHSMAWFRGRLFVGTTRSNLCLFKISKIRKNVDIWPVECPDYVYEQDMRAQIWTYDPATEANAPPNAGWTLVYQSPYISAGEETLPRELGYRGMCLFKGSSDAETCLYVATYAPARGQGGRIIRSVDGQTFEDVPMPAGFDQSIITLRLIVPFKGRLFTSPTGRAGGDPNTSGRPSIYASEDPVNGGWEIVNPPGFDDPGNVGIFEMIGCGDFLYAGTANLRGYQIWRTRAEGVPPFEWECVIYNGAHRGPLNQGVASFCIHDGLVYAGSGIQHGGIDLVTGAGPAPPELIRIYPSGEWDLIVGRPRETPDGNKVPLSGYNPGFDNFFNGYFWRMESHQGWIYLGTFDWSVMMRYANKSQWPGPFRRTLERIGIERLIAQTGGADLYRSRDGDNWMPVTTNGFDNAYNYGIRTLQSTPYGLAVGCVNPFGPKVGTWDGDKFAYQDNPRGGMEIWVGRKEQA